MFGVIFIPRSNITRKGIANARTITIKGIDRRSFLGFDLILFVKENFFATPILKREAIHKGVIKQFVTSNAPVLLVIGENAIRTRMLPKIEG